jgi:hypothetical protein
VFADPLFVKKNFGGRDLVAYNLPIERAIHDAYLRGRLPVWVSGISGGRPLLANPNAGALYPVRAILGVLPYNLAMRLFPVLHWILAGLGMMALLSALNASPAAAWIGAVTYVFSGVGISEVFYTNHHPGVMLLPWILWALARKWDSPAAQTVVLAVLLGLDFLGGDVFTIGVGIGAALLWILVEVAKGARARPLKTLAASLALGILIGLPQIVATYLWAPETARSVRGLALGEVVAYSISPFRFLELFVPYPFGTTWRLDPNELWATTVFHGRGTGFFSSLYAGALAVIALVAIPWRKPRAKPSSPKTAHGTPSTAPGIRFGRFLLLGGLLLSVPPSLLPDFVAGSPSPLPLRYPEKFGVAIACALAILTGLVFESLRRPGWKARWTIWVGAALGFAALALSLSLPATRDAVMLLTGVDLPYANRAARVIGPAFVEGAFYWMATVVALDLLRRGTRRASAAGLVLLTLVPVLATSKIAQTHPEDRLLGPTPFARFLARADPAGSYRALGEGSYPPASLIGDEQARTDSAQFETIRNEWQYYAHLLWNRGTVFNADFDVGDTSRMESLRRLSIMAAGAPNSEAFFGSLGLRWGVRYRDRRPLAGYHRVRGNNLMDWDEHQRAYPDIRLLESWRQTPDPQQEIRLLPALADGEIVFEAGPVGSGTARPGELRILEKTPERLLLDVAAPDPTWLFVLRGYFPYRTVLLDGQKVDCFPAQLAFSAVQVPAGRHRIDWRERVPGGTVSRWGPILFGIAILGIVLAERRRTGSAQDAREPVKQPSR